MIELNQLQGMLTRPTDAVQGRAKSLLEAARDAGAQGKTGEAAESFQSVLATMLIKEMRRSLPEGMFGKGPGAETYEGWFDEQVGQSMAKCNALGMDDMLREQIERARLQVQEASEAEEEVA